MRNIKSFTLFIGLILIALLIWWNLPVSIRHYRDIVFAEKIISNIDQYKTQHGLPGSTDWNTLQKLGIRMEDEDIEPMYYRINKDTYELVFVEGFDGPYLLWSSKERKWKIDMPSISEESNK